MSAAVPVAEPATPIRATTTVAGVIGYPVRHSLSPVLLNAAFAAAGIDWAYVAFEVLPGQAAKALDGVRSLGIAGLSVTMPHKSDVATAADEVSDDVALLQAANTVVRLPDGRIRVEATDGEGCVGGLRSAGTDPSGARVVVVGAGGAGRAVVLGLARAGAREIVVVNRDAAKAELAASLPGLAGLAPSSARVGSVHDIGGADIVINATPLGMGSDGRLPFDPALLAPGQVVNDLIYHPVVTPLLTAANERGAQTIGGLGMLVHQAARQFEIWTGLDAPIDAMSSAVRSRLEGRG